jgi:hypothetical protein
MKTLAFAMLLFSLPVTRFTPPEARSPKSHSMPQAARHGRWYFAQNGHAVYCMGPVVTVAGPGGGLSKVATYCRGDQPVVPLKD